MDIILDFVKFLVGAEYSFDEIKKFIIDFSEEEMLMILKEAGLR